MQTTPNSLIDSGISLLTTLALLVLFFAPLIALVVIRMNIKKSALIMQSIARDPSCVQSFWLSKVQGERNKDGTKTYLRVKLKDGRQTCLAIDQEAVRVFDLWTKQGHASAFA